MNKQQQQSLILVYFCELNDLMVIILNPPHTQKYSGKNLQHLFSFTRSELSESQNKLYT
jgi:hypothetical protein